METLLLFSGSLFVFLRVFSFSLLFFSSPGKSFLNNLMANRVGVDMPSSSLSSTFSRLVPVSRIPTAQLTTQLRNRETPEEYRPASTNQSRGTLEQQRTTELGDEMRAVQSIYTACSRDQTLSSTVQDMYRLVTTLAAEAIPESEAHLDSSIEKANAVRTIDRYVRETTSEYGTALRELSSRTHDTRLFRFHAHLGDYAGELCGLLKDDKHSSSTILSGTWTKIVKALDDCDIRVASWNASGCKGPEPSCPEKDRLEVRVQKIIKAGFTDLDMDLALFAIRSYARRNFIAHGGTLDLDQSNDFAGLANHIDYDEKTLEDVLPDEEKPMVGYWRRLLTYFRSSHIRQTGDGGWERPKALSIAPESPPPLTGPVLRSQIELGKRRESNSRDGPPPTNVKFDFGSYRRRSDPGRRGTKRPATGQSPGRASPKRVKGLFYSPSLEAIDEVQESEAWSAAELQLQLHEFGAKLAQANPHIAARVFKPQMTQLESKLVQVKARLEKKKKEQARENMGPRGPKA